MTVWAVILFLAFIFSGCIRLTGTAGYWKKDADDETAQGKSVTLDSDKLVHPSRNQANITT